MRLILKSYKNYQGGGLWKNHCAFSLSHFQAKRTIDKFHYQLLFLEIYDKWGTDSKLEMYGNGGENRLIDDSFAY